MSNSEEMKSLGFTPEYVTDLQFLNERHSAVYVGVWFVIFMVKGGMSPLLLATIGGLLIAIIVNRLLLNRREKVPEKTAIVITGCSSGIGKDAALEFAKNDFTVFATVRKPEDAKPLTAANKNIIPLIVDVTKGDTIEAAVKIVEDKLKSTGSSFLGLINCAGYGLTGCLEELSPIQIGKQYDTNVFGVIAMTNAFLPIMRTYSPAALKQKTTLQPKLINISSTAGEISLAGCGLYCSTKFALEAVTDAYRQELRAQGISVVAVQPGYIRTNFFDTFTASKGDPAKTELSKLKGSDADAVRQYYEHANDEIDKLQRNASTKFGSETNVVVDVLVDVVLSPKPHPRYGAGKDSILSTALMPWMWPTAADQMTSGAFQNLSFFRKLDGKSKSDSHAVGDKSKVVNLETSRRDEMKVD